MMIFLQHRTTSLNQLLLYINLKLVIILATIFIIHGEHHKQFQNPRTELYNAFLAMPVRAN